LLQMRSWLGWFCKCFSARKACPSGA